MSGALPLILAVDDEASNLQLLRQILQDQYRLLFAKDGQRALDLAVQEQPDLVLLDVMMPLRSGYEVCQRIREDPARAHVKIVMLSAKGRDLEVSQGLEQGADAYVTKPFSTKALMDQVRALLAGAAAPGAAPGAAQDAARGAP